MKMIVRAVCLMWALTAAPAGGFASDIPKGASALLEAVKRHDTHAVTTLLKEGADVTRAGPEGFRPLYWAAAGGDTATAKALIEAGARVNGRSTFGLTPLIIAAARAPREMVDFLIERGADVNAVATDGRTALLVAAARGRLDVVKLLVERGGNMRRTEYRGIAPVTAAAAAGAYRTARFLLERGADPDSRTDDGKTGLMLAAYRGLPHTVELLLQHGADTNLRDRWGRTALMYSVLSGTDAAVRDLLKSGADPTIRSGAGLSAVDLAERYGRRRLVAALRWIVADPLTTGPVPASIAPNPGGLPRAAAPVQPSIAAERPRKIAQIVGEYDRSRKRFTANRTLSRFKLLATDLGASFRHWDRGYFLFGDTAGIHGGDSIAHTRDDAPEDGLDLTFVTGRDGAYKPVSIQGTSQDGFEVPMEGTSVNGRMYIYHTTDYRVGPIMGRSVLAVSKDDGAEFAYLYDLSVTYFINVSVVEISCRDWPGLPRKEGEGLLLFGSGLYRKSPVRLAFQLAEEIEHKETIRYFAGLNADGSPRWSEREHDAIPVFPEDCVGELSVSFNRFLGKWIVLYNCGRERQVIVVRAADKPWGPWSEALVLFDPRRDDALGAFMHDPREGGVRDILYDPGRERVPGDCYGPYQIDWLARGDDDSTTIYFTLSTWNPYTVVLMEAVLRRAGNGAQ